MALAVVSLFTITTSYGEEGLREPNAMDRQIARIIDILMPHEHLSQKKIDAEYSERWLDNFNLAKDILTEAGVCVDILPIDDNQHSGS